MTRTTTDLLDIGKDQAIAIQAPDRPDLTYAALRELAQRTKQFLNNAGVGHQDRIAIVLPNGPEMATAFVTVAGAATTAPLNPAYRQEEFEFYLEDLNTKALPVEQRCGSPAVAAAKKLDIDILELSTEPDRAAGDFDLQLSMSGDALHEGDAAPDDVALILHTSGTTSRPKIVPLAHSNVCASATSIVETLALTDGDACLNIRPLFHIHGLIAAVLSSLRAGGRIYCSPGFNALKFFAWLEDAKPTWYTAVPTMHQAILARTSRSMDTTRSVPLRFTRSSSSSLPPQVMAELPAGITYRMVKNISAVCLSRALPG